MGHVLTTPRYASAARIGARVRALRKQRGWTTTQLAKRAGFSQQQICAVELGSINTPVETLARLAAALGVPLASLFLDETEEVVNPQLAAAVLGWKEEGEALLSALTAHYPHLDTIMAS